VLYYRLILTAVFIIVLYIISAIALSVDRQLVFNHRQSLAEQLRQETDAAMAVHLAAVLLVDVHTQSMIHAPGRCVPQIIAFLNQYLPADHYSTLLRTQGTAVLRMSAVLLSA